MVIVVRLGLLLVKLDLIFCKFFVAPVMFGRDYCHRFVEAIWPHLKHIDFEVRTFNSILWKPLKRATKKQVTAPAAQEASPATRVSTKLWVLSAIMVPPNSKVMGSFDSLDNVLRVFLPLLARYDKYQLAISNGVVSVKLDRCYVVFVAVLSKTRRCLAKHQVIWTVTHQPLEMLPTRVTATEVLVTTTQDRDTSMDDVPVGDLPYPNRPVKSLQYPLQRRISRKKEGTSTRDLGTALDERDLSHVPSCHRGRLRRLLLAFSTILDGSMAGIKTIGHRTDRLVNTKPF